MAAIVHNHAKIAQVKFANLMMGLALMKGIVKI
jgi:hypothetical protein